MSSDMFPWMSEYELKDLPDYQQIKNVLAKIDQKAKEHDMRLTYHPGPFNVLATNSDVVLRNALKELRQHGEIMDLLGLPHSPLAKINIHVGAAYGDRNSAIQRFIKNCSLLPAKVSSRLTVENDDKANMFCVTDLLSIHEATGIPVVFDYHHHQLCSGDLTTEEAMLIAYETWPASVTPVVHFSSSRKRFEDPASSEASHADFVYESINRFGLDVDIMLEAKAKEKATILFCSSLLENPRRLVSCQR
jgi:UV DNA damage endonuclease